MSESEAQTYIDDIAQQCAISYSKTAWKDQEDFDHLLKVLKTELSLGFKHLISE